jgi:single-strand DNA-binding protein
MPANINRVVLIGRLTKDPDAHGTRCMLRLAVNERRRVKGGEGESDTWVDRANFFDVVTWGPLAQTCKAYLARGRMVAVDGSLSWREWQPEEEGAKRRQYVEVIADSVRFLDAPSPPPPPAVSAPEPLVLPEPVAAPEPVVAAAAPAAARESVVAAAAPVAARESVVAAEPVAAREPGVVAREPAVAAPAAAREPGVVAPDVAVPAAVGFGGDAGLAPAA